MVNPGAKRRANLWESDKVSWPISSPSWQPARVLHPSHTRMGQAAVAILLMGKLGVISIWQSWHLSQVWQQIFCVFHSVYVFLEEPNGSTLVTRSPTGTGETLVLPLKSRVTWASDLASQPPSFLPWSCEVVMGIATSTMHLFQISPGVFLQGWADKVITVALLTKKKEHGKPGIAF